MKNYRFLPKEAIDYQISDPSEATFSRQRAGLAGDLGQRMNVRKASSEGRAPTPFTRAYMYYLHLIGNELSAPADTGPESIGAGEGQPKPVLVSDPQAGYQRIARKAFRGICATLALRNVLNLRLTMKDIDPGTIKNNSVAEAIAAAIKTAPPPESFWGKIRYLLVEYEAEGQRLREEVLAGLSPLTAFYPSPSPLTQLDQLYWYDCRQGKWFDPVADFEKKPQAGETLRVAPGTVDTMRKYLIAWLEAVLNQTPADSAKAFETLDISQDNKVGILGELDRWLKELTAGMSQQFLAEARKTALNSVGTAVVPNCTLPLFACVVKAEPNVRLETDLPVRNGRVWTTQQLEESSDTRIWGRMMGGTEAAARLRGSGNLQFQRLDDLFTPYLTIVSRLGVCEEWRLLEFKDDKGRTTEWYFLPFCREILEFLDWEKLLKSTVISHKPGSSSWTVTLSLPNLRAEKTYISQPDQDTSSAEGRVDDQILTDTLDLRVFPDFDLHCQYRKPDGSMEYLIEQPEDRSYYLRVRQSPFWDFEILPLVEDDKGELASGGVEDVAMGAQSKPKDPRHANASHCAKFFKVPHTRRPIGFKVGKRGLCFLSLMPPAITGVRPKSLEVGFDFGTSNSCVSIKRAGQDHTEVFNLEVMTTTILKTCDHKSVFDLPGDPDTWVCEDGSAMLDFFFRFNAGGRLTKLDYFPSLFVTLQSTIEPRRFFELKDGQPYFENVSIADETIISALVDYPPDPDPTIEARHTRRFVVRDEFKWPSSAINVNETATDKANNLTWRAPFLMGLRRMLVLAVAKQHHARISQMVFSYPKAFPVALVSSFSTASNKIWPNAHLISESEAVCKWLIKHSEYEHEEHVVMDVGGGTTDLVAVHTREPLCQASFRLAGGAINDYVVHSTRLQKQLLAHGAHHITDKGTLDRVGRIWQSHAIDTFKRFAWFGFVQALRDPENPCLEQVLADLRNPAPSETADGLAVRGFFLSVVLLFGGMAFHAGRLLRQALEKGNLPFTCINLHLLGNGSTYFDLLDHKIAPFGPPFEGLFRAGLDFMHPTYGRFRNPADAVPVKFQGIPIEKGRKCPKALVALGILHGEDEDLAKRLPVLAVPEDQPYYEKAAQAGSSHAIDDSVPPDLKAFFEALQKQLPNGANNSFDVVPFGAFPNKKSLGLDQELMELYGSEQSRAFVRGWEITNAKSFQQARAAQNDGAVLAVEPLFVTRLRGLVHAITQKYGRVV